MGKRRLGERSGAVLAATLALLLVAAPLADPAQARGVAASSAASVGDTSTDASPKPVVTPSPPVVGPAAPSAPPASGPPDPSPSARPGNPDPLSRPSAATPGALASEAPGPTIPGASEPTPSPRAAATALDAETATTIAVSPDHGRAGMEHTVTATVAPNPGGGTVQWYQDAVLVGSSDVGADGTARLAWTPSDSGSHDWSAAFAGADGFAASQSSPITVVVDPSTATTIHVSSGSPRDPAGVEVTVTAVLDPAPVGSIIVWSQDGAALGSLPVAGDGTSTIDVTIPTGTSVVTATFEGAPGFLASSGSVSIIGVPPPDPVCSDPMSWAESRGITSADVRAGTIAFLGATATLTPATFDPRTPPINDVTFAMWFRAMAWLVPVAVDAYLYGAPDDIALVNAYVARYSIDPDPGSATSTAVAMAFATGWDEGTNLRRQQVLNCLMVLTPSAEVRGLLDATIGANLDVNRYYGLPHNHPHNHGAMANLALIDSSDVLGRPELLDAAQARLVRDSGALVDACGMMFEQSAYYQRVNAGLWHSIVATLQAHGRVAAATTVGAASGRLDAALRHLVRPDGQLEIIGDGYPVTIVERPPLTTPRRMLCTATGWASARTSWLPTASSYTLRFGPSRRMHGHADHGGVTWYRAGRPILEDAGGTDALSDAQRTLMRSNASHNVLTATGVTLASATSLIRFASNRQRDLYVVRDRASGITRTRSLFVDPSLPLLVVFDRASSTTARTYRQYWHFDVRWQWDATQGRLTDGSMVAGVVTMDLRTGRLLPASRSTTQVMTPDGVGTQQVLTVRRQTSKASLFSVVYVGTGIKPVIRWYPGAASGSGRVRIWWGRTYRDVLIDATGIRS